jgi:hypothetical protein
LHLLTLQALLFGLETKWNHGCESETEYPNEAVDLYKRKSK